jgi:diguanylate cyclase (GGDEF)-like protein
MRGLKHIGIIPRLCIGLGWILIAFVASGALAITRVQIMSEAVDTIVNQSIPLTVAAHDIDRQLALQQLVQDDATAFNDRQLRARAFADHAQLLSDFRVIAAHDASFPAIRTLTEQGVQPPALALDAEVQVVVTWAEGNIARLGDAPDRARRLRLCPPPSLGRAPAPPPVGAQPPAGCMIPPRSLRNGMVPGSPALGRYHTAMRALNVAVTAMQATTKRTSDAARSAAIFTIALSLVVGVVVIGLLGFRLARVIGETNARLMALATRDPLTGQYNQRTLVETLDRTLAHANRYGTPCAILFLDIDHFKALNDTHGHPAGDAALKWFACSIAARVRGVDMVGRWGGEEFMAIFPETDGATALAAAERMRAAIATTPFDAVHGAHITCSIGVASYPDDGESRETLIAAADLALYRAKRQGRNQVCRANDPQARRAASAPDQAREPVLTG